MYHSIEKAAPGAGTPESGKTNNYNPIIGHFGGKSKW